MRLQLGFVYPAWPVFAFIIALICVELVVAEEPAATDSPADTKPPAAKKPAPRDALLRGKQATVLVETGDFASGSAFCIDRRGLFVTNAHVVASIETGESVRLVVGSGTKSERTVMARPVAVYDEADLALLRVPAGDEFAALALGDDSKLTETMEVTALGYPFGKLLSGKSRNPEVSVNKGRVSAIRTTNSGKIDHIQMDVPLNPGNSGGPILNSAGKVVGIAVAIIPGSGISFAVPVSRLRQFMENPALLMNCPPQDYFSTDRPPPIEIEIEQFRSQPRELVIEARFPGATEPERVFTAKRRGDRYIIKPVPFAPATPPRLRLMALSPQARLVFDSEDRKIRLGSREFRLTELSRIEPRPGQSLITTSGGQRYAGRLTLPEPLPWPAGEPPLKEFSVIDVAAYDVDEDRFRYHIWARDGDEEVAHLSGRLRLRGVPASVDPAVRQDTLAYWRFEDGMPGARVALQPIVQAVRDSSGNGNHLRSFNPGTAPSFMASVPLELVPQSGMRNTISLDNSAPPGEGFPTRDLYPMPWFGPGPDVRKIHLKNWTIEASARFTNLSAHPVQAFVSNAGSNYPKGEPKIYNVLLCSADNHLHVVAHTESGDELKITRQPLTQNDQWYHVALVSDQKKLKLYVNSGGEKGYELAGESKFDGGLYFTGDMWLLGRGGWDNHPSDQFMGQIDEVRISTAALTPGEFLFSKRPAKP